MLLIFLNNMNVPDNSMKHKKMFMVESEICLVCYHANSMINIYQVDLNLKFIPGWADVPVNVSV